MLCSSMVRWRAARRLAILVRGEVPVAETFGYGWSDLQWFTVNAMKSAFLGFDERLTLINEVIKPRYAALMA